MLEFKITPNNTIWSKDSEMVFMYLRSLENFLNTCMVARGYLYENQIYEALDIPWNPNDENRKYLNNTTYPPVQIDMIQSEENYLVIVHLATDEES